MSNKKCAFILPYFGSYKNYFPLFLKSFAKNEDYDLIIFTDNTEKYDYPKNIRVISYTLDDFRNNASRKFGFNVSLNTPYKLCDYKPAYGFLFEEYIGSYPYWGYCDCDMLFGNLNKLLSPLLDKDYDKLFAAGHLTVYKNNYENNRRFMKPQNGREFYREAFTTDKIYVFDEDCPCAQNPDQRNVHSIFINDGASVFATDLSMNVTVGKALFTRAYYSEKERRFLRRQYRTARFYWNNGNITEAFYNKSENKVEYQDYLYIHLQLRKMRVKNGVDGSDIIEISPDRFIKAEKIPQNKSEMRLATVKCPYLYWVDTYAKKIKRKLKLIK